MLELAILGLLKEQDLHGYELKKRLTDALGVVRSVSFGSLYPALGRLERAGAVRTVEVAGPSLPQTGSLGGDLAAFRARAGRARTGRSRKVYGITLAGERLFDELLVGDGTVAGEDGRVFHLRLAFARHLPAEARLRMLERRRAQLLERLGDRSRRGAGAGDRYLTSLLEHDRETTEHDLSWIERLIAGERSQPGPDPDPAAGAASAFGPAADRPAEGSGLAAPTLSGLGRIRTTGPAVAPVATLEAGPQGPPRPGPSAHITQEEPRT